ncbi:MAG TPA: HAD family hydrolase [Chryseosolibacter sp.]
MTTIRAVLFDVIGTTVLEEDPDFVNRCFRYAFSANNVRVTEENILRVRGKDKLEAIHALLVEVGEPLILSNKIFAEFERSITSGIANFREHPQLKEVVGVLKRRSIAVGVGSGLPRSVFKVLFEHLQWRKYDFDFIEVFETYAVGRPAPAMIHDMCDKLQLLPGQLLKVGDTMSDIEEGKNAKTQTAAILSGTQPADLLMSAKPDYIFTSLNDILQALR